jgi:hypothetical protein
MNVWVAAGSPSNLKTSLQRGRWGVNARLKGSWERVSNGDLFLFYVTSPVRGIVSVASVEGKAVEDNILWRDEAVIGRALYPYRVLFKPLFVLEEDEWEASKIPVRDLNVSVRAGLNGLRNQDTVRKLLSRVKKSWGVRF